VTAFAFHGFLDTRGSFTQIPDVPGANPTLADGINDAGQIVVSSSMGSFIFTSGGFAPKG
jgi:uncharacterized membrane protein